MCKMGEKGIECPNNSAMQTAINSIQALGRGFDVNFDIRLLYCKGLTESRIVEVDEEHARDIYLYDDIVVPNVSHDIKKSQDSITRLDSGVCTFQEMVEYFNRKANLHEGFPLGSFNFAFNFTGSKHIDASATKTLAMVGFYIPLTKLELIGSSLILQQHVRQAVPTHWDPLSLSSFIRKFGTHVITSVTIGGKDIIHVKQHTRSHLSILEIKNYVKDIADQRFFNRETGVKSGPLKYKGKAAESCMFSQEIYPQPIVQNIVSGKEDVTVIFRRRGGDDLAPNHNYWIRTVKYSPDVIEMTFVPICDLLDESHCKDHLARAINLYLEYKPQIEELRYFLEFQVPQVWAPIQETVPGQQRKEPICPSLQFSLMGQKLYVSQEQISVGRKPVTGLRLCLEGTKKNRLCIHLLHLASLPKIFLPYWDTHIAIGAPRWQGPEEQDSRWFEPVKWKNFSHVCSMPIEIHETFTDGPSDAHIVTGAQLGIWDFGSKNVLYMKLLYNRLPGCTIRRSLWDHSPSTQSRESHHVHSNGSTVENKLSKLVDTSVMCKGPEDQPGHWLVTGAKLGIEMAQIVLRVKYSLLNY